jgi:hypothetical protein
MFCVFITNSPSSGNIVTELDCHGKSRIQYSSILFLWNCIMKIQFHIAYGSNWTSLHTLLNQTGPRKFTVSVLQHIFNINASFTLIYHFNLTYIVNRILPSENTLFLRTNSMEQPFLET